MTGRPSAGNKRPGAPAVARNNEVKRKTRPRLGPSHPTRPLNLGRTPERRPQRDVGYNIQPANPHLTNEVVKVANDETDFQTESHDPNKHKLMSVTYVSYKQVSFRGRTRIVIRDVCLEDGQYYLLALAGVETVVRNLATAQNSPPYPLNLINNIEPTDQIAGVIESKPGGDTFVVNRIRRKAHTGGNKCHAPGQLGVLQMIKGHSSLDQKFVDNNGQRYRINRGTNVIFPPGTQFEFDALAKIAPVPKEEDDEIASNAGTENQDMDASV